MQVVRAPARLGWSWISQGFAIFMRRPWAMVGLTTLMLFTLALATLIPGAGGLVTLLLTPLLSVGYMHAIRSVQANQAVSPWTVYEYLRRPHRLVRRSLLMLGAIQGGLTLLAFFFTSLIDGGTLFKISTGSLALDDPSIQPLQLLWAGCLFATLYTPVQMAMWFAPVLVAWHGLAPIKALFYSLVGVWRNKAAFTVYMLGWLLVLVALSVATQLTALVLPAGLIALLLWPVFLVLLTALYGSFWPSYCDLIIDDAALTHKIQQVG